MNNIKIGGYIHTISIFFRWRISMSGLLATIKNNIKNSKLVRELMWSFNKEDPELESILKEIEFTRKALESARCNFNYATDEMVEYYTYTIIANEIKFGYLTRVYQQLRQSKEYVEDDSVIIPENLNERRTL